MFRELNTALLSASDQLKAGDVTAEEFCTWFLPRNRFFLQQMHGHHMIEDHQYFPVLTNMVPTPSRGFEVLENDHEMIHTGLVSLQEVGGGLAEALAGPKDRIGSRRCPTACRAS